MGGFKDLSRSDVFLTTHVAHKSWEVHESDFEEVGIRKIAIKPRQGNVMVGSGDWKSNLWYSEIYNSFYSGSVGDGTFSGMTDLDLQTTLTLESSRRLTHGQNILYVIPRQCIGTGIEPGSFTISVGAVQIKDKEGLLIGSNGRVYGDIIYTKGIAVLTNNTGLPRGEHILSWKSTWPIHTWNINCRVRDCECNYSLNPTMDESYVGNDEFAPYFTSVGLYNRFGELVAVAKMSKPVKKSSLVDTTIKIRLDVG